MQTEDNKEWDKMTQRHEENFEISSEARDYNNQEMDETRSEVELEDGPDPDARR